MLVRTLAICLTAMCCGSSLVGCSSTTARQRESRSEARGLGGVCIRSYALLQGIVDRLGDLSNPDLAANVGLQVPRRMERATSEALSVLRSTEGELRAIKAPYPMLSATKASAAALRNYADALRSADPKTARQGRRLELSFVHAGRPLAFACRRFSRGSYSFAGGSEKASSTSTSKTTNTP